MSFIQPIHFTVTQLRIAASCPRILYFDADDNRRYRRRIPQTTRIWEPGSATTAGGTLFHNAIEKFNRLAGQNPAFRSLLNRSADRETLFRDLMSFFSSQAVNRSALSEKSSDVIVNFSQCVEVYLGELADIIHYGRESGRTTEQIAAQLFAPLPRSVDVTFHVGPRRQPVHITGRLDYVFFDWRTDTLRILDYKLTPAQRPGKDHFQVATYALLYHHQHQYECDAGVFYLHPVRQLVELKWAEIWALRHKVYDLMASMAEWVRFDVEAGAGLQPPGNPEYCEACRWRAVCERRLGPKSQGQSLHGWSESQNAAEPEVQTAVTTAADDVEEILTDALPEELTEAELPPESTPDCDRHKNSSPDIAAPDPTPEILRIGLTADGKHPAEFRKACLSTHTAIVGAAGSGKTWLAKVVVEEAIRAGVPVLAIDPQGDLVQFLRQRAEIDVKHKDRSMFRQFQETVETRIFTPGTSHGIRLCLSPVRLPRAEELAHLPEARRSEEFDSLIDAVAMHLISLTLKGKKSVEQHQTFLAQVLRRLVGLEKESLTLTDIAGAIHSPEAVGIEDADLLIRKSERENLGRQLYALAHGPLARLFTGGLSLDISRMLQPVQRGKVPLNVVYLNCLTDPEKHAFLAALATELYRWMSCSGGDPSRPQLLFYIDEARDFLPAGSAEPPAKRPVSRLFTQGRKFGVGCLVCTQSPRSVDYNVFGNCSTKIIGRLETPQDSERVGEWFTTTGARPAWVAGRAGAEPGTFVGRWPNQADELDGTVFRSRELFSLHEGAWSPERVEKELADDFLHNQIRQNGL